MPPEDGGQPDTKSVELLVEQADNDSESDSEQKVVKKKRKRTRTSSNVDIQRSASLVATPIVVALEAGQTEEFEVKQYQSKKRARRVKCCFGMCLCKLGTCWKGINFANSMAFWILWGVMFAIGFEKFLMIPVCFFAIVVCFI